MTPKLFVRLRVFKVFLFLFDTTEKRWFLIWFFFKSNFKPISNCMHYSLTLLLQMIRFLLFFHSQKKVKERCVHFITQTLQKAIINDIQRPDLHTLLKYISCAELYNLSSVLPLAIMMCAKYTIKSLTEASLQTPVSGETHVKIWTKLTETLTKERIEKGNNNL